MSILFGAQWEKVGNRTQGKKRGRVSGVLKAPLPLLAQEKPRQRIHSWALEDPNLTPRPQFPDNDHSTSRLKLRLRISRAGEPIAGGET
eukprot:811101-Prorocentrum_minimum.AAC.1